MILCATLATKFKDIFVQYVISTICNACYKPFKGNLYFRFKTKHIYIRHELCEIIVQYEIRFQKFVDVDFFLSN